MSDIPNTPEELTKRAKALRFACEKAVRGDDYSIKLSTTGALWMAEQLDALVAQLTALEELQALLIKATALVVETRP